MQELTFEQVENVGGGHWFWGGLAFWALEKSANAYYDGVTSGSAVPTVSPGFVGGPHNNDPLL